MSRVLIPLVVFLGLVALLGAGLLWQRDGLDSPLMDKPAPAFAAPRLLAPEETIRLADLTGTPFVINVWASWCVACRAEHEQVMALAEHVPVYGLNYKDERASAQEWLARQGNAYRASIFDPEGGIGMDYGVYGVPETYLVDSEGVIRYKHVGALQPETLRKEFLPRLKQMRGAQG